MIESEIKQKNFLRTIDSKMSNYWWLLSSILRLSVSLDVTVLMNLLINSGRFHCGPINNSECYRTHVIELARVKISPFAATKLSSSAKQRSNQRFKTIETWEIFSLTKRNHDCRSCGRQIWPFYCVLDRYRTLNLHVRLLTVFFSQYYWWLILN
jgi:hypothetical protein